MSKTKTERIASIEDRIAELENQRKQLIQKQKQNERKARTRRLIERGAILESLIADADTYTNEQLQTALKHTIGSKYGREALHRAKHPQRGENAPTKPASPPQGNATPTPAKTDTAQQEAATPAPAGAGGGARDGG